MGMYPFAAEKVLDILGIKARKQGDELYAVCPMEGCSDKTGHLCINQKNDKVYCHKCGFSGNTLTLYAHLTGMNTKDAYADLLKQSGIKDKGILYQREMVKKRELEAKEERPLLSIDDRSKAYERFLNCLTIDENHMRHLFERGFDEYYIYMRSYRSTPDVSKLRAIMTELMNEGTRLDGVPGFYKDKNGWKVIKTKKAIFVPVVDSRNRIQGMQYRIDDQLRCYRLREDNIEKESLSAEEKQLIQFLKKGKYGFPLAVIRENVTNIDVKKTIASLKEKGIVSLEAKYKWLSSQGYENGCGALGFIHWACGFDWDGDRIRPHIPQKGKLVLTEGAMKADLFHQLTQQPTIAIPGVTNRKQLPAVLKECKAYGVKTVCDCLDMDYLENKSVQDACKDIKRMIIDSGLNYERYTWDPKFKGIDDYYANKVKGIVR